MLKRFIYVFGKAQVSAFIGGMADYVTMVFLTEMFHIHYIYTIAIGGVVGAFLNFWLNRNWTFKSHDTKYNSTFFIQLLKFAFVVATSIFLKASGTYFITSNLGFDYKISRLITDLFVSLAVNFMLQKNWVFRKDPASP